MLPVNYVIYTQWKTTVTVHIKSRSQPRFNYFCHASATCAHKQARGKSLNFFFFLLTRDPFEYFQRTTARTHVNPFLFPAKRKTKGSPKAGKGKNLRQTTGTLPLSRDQVFCVINE